MAAVPVPQPKSSARDWLALDDGPIVLEPLVAWATTPNSGAVVAFLGVVRDHAEGRDDVVALTYEAYEEPAQRRLAEIVAARARRVARGRPRRGRAPPGAARALGDRGRGRRVEPAPRGSLRGRARMHRPGQGERADLEEGALVRRLRLGDSAQQPIRALAVVGTTATRAGWMLECNS